MKAVGLRADTKKECRGSINQMYHRNYLGMAYRLSIDHSYTLLARLTFPSHAHYNSVPISVGIPWKSHFHAHLHVALVCVVSGTGERLLEIDTVQAQVRSGWTGYVV